MKPPLNPGRRLPVAVRGPQHLEAAPSSEPITRRQEAAGWPPTTTPAKHTATPVLLVLNVLLAEAAPLCFTD